MPTGCLLEYELAARYCSGESASSQDPVWQARAEQFTYTVSTPAEIRLLNSPCAGSGLQEAAFLPQSKELLIWVVVCSRMHFGGSAFSPRRPVSLWQASLCSPIQFYFRVCLSPCPPSPCYGPPARDPVPTGGRRQCRSQHRCVADPSLLLSAAAAGAGRGSLAADPAIRAHGACQQPSDAASVMGPARMHCTPARCLWAGQISSSNSRGPGLMAACVQALERTVPGRTGLAGGGPC